MTSPAWYAVMTRPNEEEKAASNLRRQGFDAYLPRYWRLHRHARKTTAVARPLFPRYLFVRMDVARQRWRAVNSTFGVSALVCQGERPAQLPLGIVENLRAREDETGFIQLEPTEGSLEQRFRPGDRVEVTDGAFADSMGLYEGLAGKDRVAILLDLLCRKVRVILDRSAVRVTV